MATGSRHRLHSLTRANYVNRSVGFLACFVAIALLAQERGWSWQAMTFPAMLLLLYPHLLVLAFRLRRAGREAEVRAMLLESLPLGMLVAWMAFFLPLSFALFTSALLNNALIGGQQQLLRSLGLFALGILMGGMLTGWQFLPDGPILVEIISMAILLAYTLMVAFVAHSQDMRLISSLRENEERNRIFQALVEMSASADLTSDLDEFLNEALGRVHDHYPRNGIGIVVRQAGRNTGFRFAAFVGIDGNQQEDVLQALAKTPLPQDEFHLRTSLNGATFHFLFMKGEIRGHEGLIILRTEQINRVLYQSMDLFLELLAATIENKLMARELKHAAERDPLTGVFNRGYLEAELDHAIRNRQHHASMDFSVLLLDVIGLKRINDAHGHIAGDIYLQRAAETLQSICRTSDVLVRYGGDEFVILAHGSTLAGAQGLADRIRQEVTGKQVLLGDDPDSSPTVPLNISIGIASSAETTPERVLKVADAAMYENKTAWYRDNNVEQIRRHG